MALWKIPFLLVIWKSYLVVSTPPESAPPNSQRPYKELSWNALLLQGRDIGRTIVNSLVAFVLLVELAFASGISASGIRRLDNDLGSLDLSNANAVSPLFLVGVVCTLLGGLLRHWSYDAMGRHFTFQLSILDDHQLITNGPYAYVRHPGYTALILTFFGMSACELSSGTWWIEARIFDTVWGKCLGSLGVIAALQLVMVVSRAPAEDRMLYEKFGTQWDEWARKVPYRCIPGVW